MAGATDTSMTTTNMIPFQAGVIGESDGENRARLTMFVTKVAGQVNSANESVDGIVDLAVPYTQRRQDLLNPNGVNLIRAFPGRGMRIWGARNLTDDTEWRYVNVRRLFLFLESSIDEMGGLPAAHVGFRTVRADR